MGYLTDMVMRNNEKYFAKLSQDVRKNVKDVYYILKDRKITRNNPFIYNDHDNGLCLFSDRKNKAIIQMESQNYIFFIIKNNKNGFETIKVYVIDKNEVFYTLVSIEESEEFVTQFLHKLPEPIWTTSVINNDGKEVWNPYFTINPFKLQDISVVDAFVFYLLNAPMELNSE